MSEPPDQDALTAWSGLRDAAARLDADPRLLTALRRLRRRLPGDEKFGDPLSTGGATTLAYVARGVSGLRPERDSAISEIGMAGLQLWQSVSERVGRGRGDQDLALLFTDLVDFSTWVLSAGDAAAVELLRQVETAVERPITERGGRIDKRLGDGLLATFLDAPAAVEAALDALEALDRVEVAGYRPRMRAGVHWGRPRRIGGNYLGLDVSIAACVGDSARAGQVLVSTPALDQLGGAADGLRIGRRKTLRSRAAPSGLLVAAVGRDPEAGKDSADAEPSRAS